MFGYITVHKDELKIKDYNTYRGYYCGLCRELGKCHGQLSRLTLSYDMTFLVILLTSLYETETQSETLRCPLHPAMKHLTLRNEFTTYAADMNILLTYYNLLDDWNDEKKLSSLAMAQTLRKSLQQITKQYPAKAEAVKLYISRLSECEATKEQSLDTAAGYTGEMLGEIFAWQEDEWSNSLRKIGFYLGKFIYLCDAMEDREEDKKSGNYNPLLYHCEQPGFDAHMQDILTMMVAECAREFEKLPILLHTDILRNILYAGIWSRYEAVRTRDELRTRQPASPNSAPQPKSEEIIKKL